MQEALHALYNDDDVAFLNGIFAEYPKVAKKFEAYLELAPLQRITKAVHDLKDLPRTGWVLRGIQNVESVYEHSLHVQAQAFALAPERVDAFRAKAMGLFSDFAEAVTGDFTPYDTIQKPEKYRLERLVMQMLYEKSPQKDKVCGLIEEYQAQESETAKWVHDIDKLDPMFVALQYEAKDARHTDLFDEFYNGSGPKLKTPEGKEIAQYLHDNRADITEQYRSIFADEKHAAASRAGWLMGGR